METGASTAAESKTLKQLKERYKQRVDEGRLDVAKLAEFATVIDAHEAKEREPVAHIVTGDNRLLVFKRPSQDDWEDVTERLRKGERVAVCNRQLALSCVLEPTAADLPDLFRRWPGLHARIADALTVLVGADEELTAKKD